MLWTAEPPWTLNRCWFLVGWGSAKAGKSVEYNLSVELSELKCTGNSCCALMGWSLVFSEQKLQFCQGILWSLPSLSCPQKSSCFFGLKQTCGKQAMPMLVRSGVARSFGPSAKELARYKQHDFIRFLNKKTQRILLVGESALAGFPLELESRFTKVPKFSIRMPLFKGTAAEAKADNISVACRYFCVSPLTLTDMS